MHVCTNLAMQLSEHVRRLAINLNSNLMLVNGLEFVKFREQAFNHYLFIGN